MVAQPFTEERKLASGVGMDRAARQAARASLHACISVGLVVMQVAAGAAIWNWLGGAVGLAKLDMGIAVLFGCLLGLMKGLVMPASWFSWSATLAVVARTVLLVGVGYLASRNVGASEWSWGAVEKLLGMLK